MTERHLYALAIGSNRALSARLRPADILSAAITAMAGDCRIMSVAPTFITAPIGPSRRRFANGALVIASPLQPDALLRRIKQVERQFGRRRGRRWGARTLDIDIILWSGGRWKTRDLVIPHPAFRGRDFVLGPLTRIAPRWRDPVTHLTVRQLYARLQKSAPKPRARG